MVILTVCAGAAVAAVALPTCAAGLSLRRGHRRRRLRAGPALAADALATSTWTSDAPSVLSGSLAFFERQWSFHSAVSSWSDGAEDSEEPFLLVSQEELKLIAELRESVRADLREEPWAARWFEDGELLRFLRAKGGALGEARALLKKALQWRAERAREWGVDLAETGSFGAVHGAFLKASACALLGDGRLGRVCSDGDAAAGCDGGPPDWWTFLHEHLHMDLYSSDRFGIPISFNDFGGCDLQGCAREVGIEVLLRYVVYFNDYFLDCARQASRARRERDCGGGGGGGEGGEWVALHGGIVVVDAEGLSWRHKDDVKVFQEIAQVARFLHPERQRKCFIVRAPRMFSMLWKLISPTLDPRARDKISIVGAGEPLDPLFEELGPEKVPECLGGDFLGLPRRPKAAVPEGAFQAHRQRLAAARGSSGQHAT
mmetsp:Transcript_78176/g.253781  ORF Transcript_78176/g.253781 Transcript_78176/m.253781 type:complete len:430 (-) Transcript_78176:216-1505(-)